MFDFVSIIFDNDTEINLLKVQLFSFTFVNLNIINQIYILFNDAQNKNSTFMEKYNNFSNIIVLFDISSDTSCGV